MVKGAAGLSISGILLGMLVLAGCEVTDVPEGGPVNVKFWVEKDHYKIGSSITTTLKNEAEIPISYNLCFSRLVHKTGEQWKEMGAHPICTSEVKDLAPGDSTSYFMELSSKMELPEGLYKVKTNIEVEKKKTLTTQSFEVKADTL